jgi:hypothetical protein
MWFRFTAACAPSIAEEGSKAMGVKRKPFYDLDEVCALLGMSERDLTAFVLSGELTLSAAVAGLHVVYGTFEEIDVHEWHRIPEGRRYIIGTVDLRRDDAWMVLREGSHEITQLKAPEGEYVDIDDWHSNASHTVHRDDLVVCRAEIERFAAAHLEPAEVQGTTAQQPARRGAPPRYDWDGFWVEVCRRVHEEGVPATQGELIRLMLDWFTETGRRLPDASTLKKKLSPLWRLLAPQDANLPHNATERHRA